jgi:hypothetical protein
MPHLASSVHQKLKRKGWRRRLCAHVVSSAFSRGKCCMDSKRRALSSFVRYPGVYVRGMRSSTFSGNRLCARLHLVTSESDCGSSTNLGTGTMRDKDCSSAQRDSAHLKPRYWWNCSRARRARFYPQPTKHARTSKKDLHYGDPDCARFVCVRFLPTQVPSGRLVNLTAQGWHSQKSHSGETAFCSDESERFFTLIAMPLARKFR